MGRRISALADWLLTEQIRQIFEESEQTYGSPRIFKELKLGRGMAIGEKRVARLMRQAGLVSIHAKTAKARRPEERSIGSPPTWSAATSASTRPIACASHCPSAQRRDRIGFQTMRSTPTLSETRTQSLRAGEAEPDRRCSDRPRVSHEESKCADGHGGERRCSSVVRRAAHCVSEPCLHRSSGR